MTHPTGYPQTDYLDRAAEPAALPANPVPTAEHSAVRLAEALHKELELLGVGLDDLRSKLHPVLAPEGVEVMRGETRSGEPVPTSPQVDTLLLALRTVQRFQGAVGHLLARVEL